VVVARAMGAVAKATVVAARARARAVAAMVAAAKAAVAADWGVAERERAAEGSVVAARATEATWAAMAMMPVMPVGVSSRRQGSAPGEAASTLARCTCSCVAGSRPA
jgi:hypothetical protein